MAAHALTGRRLSPAVPAACPCPPDARCTVLRALPSYPPGGAGALPGPPGATARGRAGASGVADRVCPAGRRPSGTVSGRRPDARVHRGHPAWGFPAVGAGGGPCRMRVTLRGTACQGRGVPAARPVGAGGVVGTVGGRLRGVAHTRPCHRLDCWWGHQAGGRRATPAYPP